MIPPGTLRPPGGLYRKTVTADPARPDFAELWRVAHPGDGLHPWITSRYGGRCRGCGGVFEAGELIRYCEDEDGYLAECCGADPP